MSSSRNESVEYIYTAFITLKNGKRIYASQYGLKAFCIPVTLAKDVGGFILSFFERTVNYVKR